MNKKELVRKVAETLRENKVKKPIAEKVHTFHITDDEGNKADFSVRQKGRSVIYTADDVTKIIDACLFVIVEAIKRGEEVAIYGFGNLKLHHRAARRTKEPGTDKWCEVKARYVPKFFFGKDLRMAARVYELTNPIGAEQQVQETETGGDD